MRSILLRKEELCYSGAEHRGIIAPSSLDGFSPPLPGIGNQREGVLDEIVYPIKMLTHIVEIALGFRVHRSRS
jgi:hypothetical protein